MNNGTDTRRQAQQNTGHRTWCDNRDHRTDGVDRCSSDLVDLTVETSRGQEEPEQGWWAWLTAPASDGRVTLAIEGRPEPGEAAVSFEVPIWQVHVLWEILADELGHARLGDLLERMAP